MNNVRSIISAVAGVTLAMGLFAVPAEAKKYVYSPIVHEGEREVAYYLDWQETASGDEVVGHEVEFEFGIGPRDMLAFYVVYGNGAGEGTELLRYKAEWIRQLWEQGERAVDGGIYLEYQINDDPTKADKVEFKPLLQKDIGRITLTGNGIFEKQIGENAKGGTELGYAAKIAYRKYRWGTPSIEAFGGLGEIKNFKRPQDQGHILGPVIDFRVSRAVSLQLGALFGLTNGSEDVRLKSQIAFEWY